MKMIQRLDINKERLSDLIKARLSLHDIAVKLGVKLSFVRSRLKIFGLKTNPTMKMSEQAKRKISKGRKAFLAANPDKHNWRNNSKFKSVPCEKLKEFLKKKDIQFIEEFEPLVNQGRFYSLDIAFPDKMIAIEVNGNQHYENDGKLKPYYQKRHDEIESNGWKIYEFHYSICFNESALEKMIPEIIESEKKIHWDYCSYKPRQKTKKISELNPLWRKQPRLKSRKVERPSKETLEKLIWTKPSTKIAQEFGVSGKAIEKWCKAYGISKPPRGYWMVHSEGLEPPT